MDGISDCSDKSDECTFDIFSSKDNLIGNPIFRMMLWLMAIIALLGNSVSIRIKSRAVLHVFFHS